MAKANSSAHINFVGRDTEIGILTDDLNKQKSIRFVVGESGVGKSRLLDMLYNKLRDKSEFFVGYYDRSKALVSESQSITYPFNIALISLIENIKESESLSERMKGAGKRLHDTLITFSKESGIKLAEAIVEDIAKKAGLEQTYNLARKFLKAFSNQKSSIMLAEDYISKHKEDAFHSYLGIIRSLVEEFKEREFILIFDQVESAGKASIDFLLNFIKMMPDRFHIVVAYKVEDRKWGDEIDRKLFEDTRDKLLQDLGAKELRLEGLSEEEIGKWIKLIKNVQIPLVPDLRRIRENSAGLPVILEPWINQSVGLNYEEIKRDQLCQQLTRASNDMNDEDKIKLTKLSILLQPISNEKLARYLQLTDIDHLNPFMDRLVERGIFERNSSWFRHELIKRCFEDALDTESKLRYHRRASQFYAELKKRRKKKKNKINYDDGEFEIDISYGFHLYEAQNHKESFVQNQMLALYAVRLGELDLAERCYKRVIKDAKIMGRIEDEKSCIRELSTNVYSIWGRYDEAYANLIDLSDYYRNKKDEAKLAVVLDDIGRIDYRKGEYEKALKNYDESLRVQRRVGNQSGIAAILDDIASIHEKKGDYEKALDNYDESLRILRRLGHQSGIAASLNNLAIVHKKKGEFEKASKNYDESLEIAVRLGDQSAISAAANNIGRLLEEKGEYEGALRNYDASLEIARKLGDQSGIAASLNNMGIVYAKKGEYEKALRNYDASLEIARKLGDQYSIAQTLNSIGTVYLNRGEYDKALGYYEDSLEIRNRLGDQPGIRASLNNIKIIKEKKRNDS